jgi:hypothetical protein
MASPSRARPNTTCLPSHCGAGASVKKNWLQGAGEEGRGTRKDVGAGGEGRSEGRHGATDKRAGVGETAGQPTWARTGTRHADAAKLGAGGEGPEGKN